LGKKGGGGEKTDCEKGEGEAPAHGKSGSGGGEFSSCEGNKFKERKKRIARRLKEGGVSLKPASRSGKNLILNERGEREIVGGEENDIALHRSKGASSRISEKKRDDSARFAGGQRESGKKGKLTKKPRWGKKKKSSSPPQRRRGKGRPFPSEEKNSIEERGGSYLKEDSRCRLTRKGKPISDY